MLCTSRRPGSLQNVVKLNIHICVCGHLLEAEAGERSNRGRVHVCVSVNVSLQAGAGVNLLLALAPLCALLGWHMPDVCSAAMHDITAAVRHIVNVCSKP